MAASSLRRALATKPNTLLFQPSQLSSFSTNDSPPFSLFQVGQSTILSESNPNKNCRYSSLPNPAFTRYRPIYPYAIRKLAARKSTRPRGRVFLRVSLFVSSCFTLKLVYNLKFRAFCEEGKVSLAEELFVEKEFMFKPDIHSYNVMSEAYLKGKDCIKFDELMNEVLSKGLESNVNTYKHRIMRLCNDKESVLNANKFLDEMAKCCLL
ncbi:hypothetical protein RDABS01_022473 [Bienertia sinuspersici]